MHTTFLLKRVYEPPGDNDGYRVLVDRLWPRGLKKEAAGVDEWAKEVAPSTALRKWFNHDPEKWPVFREKYHAELKENPALPAFLAGLKKHRKITLLFGARDEARNQAVVLKELLDQKR
ncbi:DUF488 domain-containing protein [Niabella beijingensis]|uniref:DUF488 domain-containing protein n=1 Tax=Niabella beijingensis TaxID=2872700 RepID=UPI001CBC4FA5|nr:DUF488 domain-containing protein [Niabella beijingensis]MBZ4190372.1 DUF488 domain-containing protein [Niabella beijingensis]